MLYDIIRSLEGSTRSPHCPMRPVTKKFLFWHWTEHLYHDYEILEIGVFMIGVGNHFRVNSKCKYCGKYNRAHFVEYETLIKLGYTPKQIEEFSNIQL